MKWIPVGGLDDRACDYEIFLPKISVESLKLTQTKQKKPPFHVDPLFDRRTNTPAEPILLQVYDVLLNHQNYKESLNSLNLLIETLAPPSRVAEKCFLV